MTEKRKDPDIGTVLVTRKLSVQPNNKTPIKANQLIAEK